MAKKAAAEATEEPKAKKSNLPERPEFKYSMEDLAEAVGLEPATIRARLRNSEFQKEGRYWGWNVKKDFDAVAKFLTSKPAPAEKATEEKAPAKKKAKAKAA